MAMIPNRARYIINIKMESEKKSDPFPINSSFAFISGPGYGLTVTINIEAYEYTKDLSQGAGIKVQLN